LVKTPICGLLGISYPIIQGGMAYLGTAELVSAVSEGGGLGIIGAGHAPTEWVKNQIGTVKMITDKPFGVNIMLMSPFVEQIVDMVIEEKVPVVTTGGGNPGVYVSKLKQAGIIVVPVVSIVALAKRLERLGVDAIIAEGVESGGHVGETTAMALVPQVVDSVKLPVIAAGGVADGRGLAAALALGAQGVQMGTRFVCAKECIAHNLFKQKIIDAKDRDTITTGHSLGHPVRCLKNKLTQQFHAMEKEGVPAEELEALGMGSMRAGVIDGDLVKGSLMIGQIAGLIKDVKPAGQIIEDIVAEAEEVIANLSGVIATH